MMRLSDAGETELSLLLRHDPARRFDPTATRSRSPSGSGYGEGRCALLYGAESATPARCATTMCRARNAFCLRHGGLPLGRVAGPRRGGANASGLRICATGCSTTASRSTRWRRRCPGRGSRRVTTRSCARCAAPPRRTRARASRWRTSRTATSTARVSTSRCSTRSKPGRERRAVARDQARRHRGDPRGGRHALASPRRRRRSPAVDGAREGRSRRRGAARA